MMISLLLIFTAGLAVSSFLSAAEMAFVSINSLKMRERADTGDFQARKILKLHQDPQNFLSAVLIGNNIANIAATACLTYGFDFYLGWKSEWAVTAVMAPVLIIFCEMVPKDYGRLHAETFLIQHARVLGWLQKFFYAPVKLILAGVEKGLGRFKNILDRDIFVSEKEFRMLIEESARTGILEEHEKKLIETILDFERTHLSSVMIPLEQAAKAEIHATIAEIKAIARRERSPMVLIYEEVPSIVVGIVYVYDILFEEDETQHLKDFLRAPIFLSSTTSSEKAFLTLQQKRQSYAVVMNEEADAVGIVPIEKLVQI